MEYRSCNSPDPYGNGVQFNNTRNNTPAGFAIASMVCGILSITMCCTGFFSLFFGALGILFAILTNRKGKAMPGMSIAGLSTSIVGMLVGFYFLAAAFIQLPAMLQDPQYRRELDAVYEQQFGMDFDEFWEYYLQNMQ